MESMRRAEANTCYAYSHCHNGEVSYGFRMVGEVGEDWYHDDTYTVYPRYIHNESAGWSGYIARRFDGDKLIMKKDYNRLKDMVENARTDIMSSLKKVARERDRELQIGDYLFCYDDYHEEWCDSDNVKHEVYDVSSVCYKVTEISNDGYKVVRSLIISDVSLDFEEDEKEYSDDYGREKIEKSLLIDESQYAKAMATAQSVRDELVEKIKTLLYGKR